MVDQLYECPSCQHRRDLTLENEPACCPGCKRGSRDNPHESTLPGPDSIPYGEFCRCSRCGYVQRSTITFDYYGEVGEKLLCESCQLHMPMNKTAEIMNEKLFGDKP